jgi:ATP-dependent DNA helicase RecG
MTPIEISDAHIKMTNSSWDYFLDPYHTINDIDEQKIKAFMKKAHVDDDIKNVYNKFELLRNDKISFGCYLLFNNNDKAMLTNIEIGRFQTETIIKDSKSIYGDIISQVDTVMEFIYKHINKAYIITGKPQRDERWDYPMDAIREIVINMIVHRDYRSSGHTTVKIFDDRIEFFNQGKLPEELTLDKIKSGQYKSIPRNLQIANIFKEAEIIEKYGSGIKRIIESFRNYGLREPLFEQTMGGISVMAYKETAQENQETAQENQETAQENQETAQENQETAQENTRSKIIKLIKLNAYITKDELRFELKKADGTIKEHLSKLKNDGIIKRIGSTKSGKWEVIGEK